MSDNYRQDLFNNYHTHTAFLDRSDEEKTEWFRWYFSKNYLPHLPKDIPLSEHSVLEIGCNKGYLLNVLRENGCQSLTGIDLSPVDLDVAKKICPTATLSCIDAFEFLETNQIKFSIIIIKAVLEHMPKDKIMPLISAMAKALEPGGILIIDVPNMDWLFANHERYMDFTHEVGFTRESLAQVMRNYFETISIHPIETSKPKGMLQSLLKYSSRLFLTILFLSIQAEWQGKVSWHRALVGIGTKK